MNNNVYTEIDVLKILSEKNEGSIIENDSLILPADKLTIKAQIINCQEMNGTYSAHVLFFADHPIFDQELVESCAGVGKNANEAIEMCTENFGATVLMNVKASLKCDGDDYITAELDGKKHIFHVPCFTGSLNMGEQFLEKGDLWGLVKDVIPQYLGCKKVYWIKLFAAMSGESITCEARINGIVYSGLTEYMKQKLPLNGKNTEYSTYKAFIVLIQKDETFEPCPYNGEQVAELVETAIEKLKNVNSQETHDKAIQEIIDSAPVSSLGWEVAGITPELYCMMVLNLNENEGLMYRYNDNIQSIKTSQLTSYDLIARGVYGYIMKNNPSKEDNLKILASSGMFQAVNKAILGGAKMEELRCSDILYSVDENYRIY